MRAPLLSPFRRASPLSIRPEALKPGDNLRGAGLMTVSMIGFTCNDTVMKSVAQTMPMYQAVALRGLAVMIVLLLLAQRGKGLRLRIAPADRGVMGLRLVGEVGSTVLFLGALQHMAIGDLAAVMQSLPLIIMLGAAVMFGETLGWRRTSAVIVGLIGVMIVLRPGSGTFGVWSLVALGAVAMVTLRDLVTRRLGPEVTTAAIAFYAASATAIFALIVSLWQGWMPPSPGQLAALMLAGGFLTIGYVCGVAAMRIGEVGFVAPFRYTSLIVAIAAGYVVFGDWPDRWTWVGSTLVVGAGAYTIWRETMLGRR